MSKVRKEDLSTKGEGTLAPAENLQTSANRPVSETDQAESATETVARFMQENIALKQSLDELQTVIGALIEENNALRAQASTGIFVTDGATVEVVVPPTPPKPTLRGCVVALENRIEEAMNTAGANKGRQVRPGPLTAMLAVLQEFRRNHPNTPQPDPFLDLA